MDLAMYHKILEENLPLAKTLKMGFEWIFHHESDSKPTTTKEWKKNKHTEVMERPSQPPGFNFL